MTPRWTTWQLCRHSPLFTSTDSLSLFFFSDHSLPQFSLPCSLSPYFSVHSQCRLEFSVWILLWRWGSCTVGCTTSLTTTPKKCYHQNNDDDDDVTSADCFDRPRTQLAFVVSTAVPVLSSVVRHLGMSPMHFPWTFLSFSLSLLLTQPLCLFSFVHLCAIFFCFP